MSPSDVIETLTAVLPTKQPVYLWGAPGGGKSSVVRQVAAELKLEFRDLRATLLDPVDLRGLPKVSGKKTTWCPPDFLPDGGSGVLLLDELAQSPLLVQNSFLQLVLDRRLGEYVLPDGWAVLAASNRVEDRAGAGRIGTALANRFLHVDLEISVEDWQGWAVAHNIAPEIRAFIRFRPAMLSVFDPASNPRAFASPRSWEFASRVFQSAPQRLLQRVLAGCVGDGPAAEFAAFLKLYEQLPDVDAVLANPTSSPVPSREPAVLFSLVGAMVERCRKNKSLAGNFARYAQRLPDEFAVLALRDAVSLDRSLVSQPDVQKWIAAARQKGLFAAA
jgi:hypothetical protein